jgi:hypothetical protein
MILSENRRPLFGIVLVRALKPEMPCRCKALSVSLIAGLDRAIHLFSLQGVG